MPTNKRVNVMLDQESLAFTRSVAQSIQATTGAELNRSELIRAILGALSDLRINFARCRTEIEIRHELADFVRHLVEQKRYTPPHPPGGY